jgi:hypothetical protein
VQNETNGVQMRCDDVDETDGRRHVQITQLAQAHACSALPPSLFASASMCLRFLSRNIQKNSPCPRTSHSGHMPTRTTAPEHAGAEKPHQASWRHKYLHCYIATLLRCYIATLLHCYIATLLHCYIATLLHCYIATLLHCYIAQDCWRSPTLETQATCEMCDEVGGNLWFLTTTCSAGHDVEPSA